MSWNRKKSDAKRKDLEALKAYSLWLLGRRDYSEKEMNDKLKGYCQHPGDVEKVILYLYDMNYLNDQRFAEARIRSRAELSRHGPQRIRQELKQKGIADTILQEAFEAYDSAYWTQQCQALYSARYHQPPEDFKAKQKRLRFLVGRGFSVADALSAVEEPEACTAD